MEGMEMKRKNSFWRNKKVLVTGHEGFLGSHITKTLLNYGSRVFGIDKVKSRHLSVLAGLRGRMVCIKGDIVNLKLLKKLISKYKPQIIFHLAAETIVGEAHRDPLKAFKSNIEGTWNILEASRDKIFIKAVVAASSDKAYGTHRKLPYKEDAPLKGEHPYDASKSCADLLCRTYYRAYNVPVCVTRCGNIYGPGDFHFSRIVPDAIRRALANKTLLIRSNGKFIRDYIYVEDVVDALTLLAEKMVKKGISGEAFNFANERPISVLALVKKIHSLIHDSKDTIKVKISDTAKYEIERQYLSAEKARIVLGWASRTDIENGLSNTIDWYRRHLKSR